MKESNKIYGQWIKFDKDNNDLENNERVVCDRGYGYEFLVYNDDYKCWDTEDGDDRAYDLDMVIAYYRVPVRNKE